MNAITAQFNQILAFAKDYNLPATKKRAILREFLQTKILCLIYQEKASQNLFFVGGTSLRLLRGLDRFSEDLDFDAPEISSDEIDKLLKFTGNQLRRENIDLDFYRNRTKGKIHYEFRFPSLLSELKLSQNPEEKLAIKFDFEFFWKSQTREVIFLNRYGLLANIVTKTTGQLLIEKLVAYLDRRQTQPRDLYDIVWLISRQTKPDWSFAKKNKTSPAIINAAINKFDREKNKLIGFKTKLAPFLFDEKNHTNLDFFHNLVGDFGK